MGIATFRSWCSPSQLPHHIQQPWGQSCSRIFEAVQWRLTRWPGLGVVGQWGCRHCLGEPPQGSPGEEKQTTVGFHLPRFCSPSFSYFPFIRNDWRVVWDKGILHPSGQEQIPTLLTNCCVAVYNCWNELLFWPLEASLLSCDLLTLWLLSEYQPDFMLSYHLTITTNISNVCSLISN